jgi:hypothetical protein
MATTKKQPGPKKPYVPAPRAGLTRNPGATPAQQMVRALPPAPTYGAGPQSSGLNASNMTWVSDQPVPDPVTGMTVYPDGTVIGANGDYWAPDGTFYPANGFPEGSGLTAPAYQGYGAAGSQFYGMHEQMQEQMARLGLDRIPHTIMGVPSWRRYLMGRTSLAGFAPGSQDPVQQAPDPGEDEMTRHRTEIDNIRQQAKLRAGMLRKGLNSLPTKLMLRSR